PPAPVMADRGAPPPPAQEGRPPPAEPPPRPAARNQPVDDAVLRVFGRPEAAHLRENGDQRVLPQEGRFPRHVRAGEEPDAAGLRILRRRQIAIIRDEGRTVAPQRLLDARIPATLDDRGEA